MYVWSMNGWMDVVVCIYAAVSVTGVRSNLPTMPKMANNLYKKLRSDLTRILINKLKVWKLRLEESEGKLRHRRREKRKKERKRGGREREGGREERRRQIKQMLKERIRNRSLGSFSLCGCFLPCVLYHTLLNTNLSLNRASLSTRSSFFQ